MKKILFLLLIAFATNAQTTDTSVKSVVSVGGKLYQKTVTTSFQLLDNILINAINQSKQDSAFNATQVARLKANQSILDKQIKDAVTAGFKPSKRDSALFEREKKRLKIN